MRAGSNRSRGWFLKRKKPLKRSTKPLKRTPLKRSTKPIRKVSAKQAKKMRDFRQGITGEEMCAKCGNEPGTDPDHILKRSKRPDLVGDPSNRRMLCRSCHREVTDFPDVEGESFELNSDKIYRKSEE